MSKKEKNVANYNDFLKNLSSSNNKNYQEVIYGINNSNKKIEYIELTKLVPANKEWNFFPPITEEKMLEMIFSIQENGLFNPIIVWEQEEGFMILSGHNRVKAYERILSEYSDAPNFNANEYEKIPAIIYDKNEINENKAKEIIIDTNYIQREEDKRLMPKIIKNRLDIVRSRKDTKGRTIDIVAKELGLSRTKVYEDQLIANKIIPELSELFFSDKISKKSLLRFGWFNKGVQKWIYKEFKNLINNDNVMKIKKTMNKEEIRKCFTRKNIKKVSVIIKVPEQLKDDFKKMANKWLKENELNS